MCQSVPSSLFHVARGTTRGKSQNPVLDIEGSGLSLCDILSFLVSPFSINISTILSILALFFTSYIHISHWCMSFCVIVFRTMIPFWWTYFSYRLLHRAAGYTPDTTSFHQDTPAKRALLVRALVRLVTSAAARHKALLAAKPQVFTATILGLLTHLEDTLTASEYLSFAMILKTVHVIFVKSIRIENCELS